VSNRISTYPDATYYETALNVGPLGTLPPWWTDITARALGVQDSYLGKNYELDRFEAGESHPVFDNRDGALDPSNTSGPYFPNLKPYRRLRTRQRFNPNELTGDQATAGESSGQLGAIPVEMNVVSDAVGASLSIVASGSAFQGGQVYQAVLPSGTAAGSTVLMVQAAYVVPGRWYSFQAQARIPSGDSISTSVSILWFDASGNSLTPASGTASTLTSGSSTWIQLAASGQAPAGAYSASLKVQTASGALAQSTTWQLDGLQWENSATPTPFQAPGTLGANLLPRTVATGGASIDQTKSSAAAHFYSAAGSLALASSLAAAPAGQSTALAWTTPSGTTNSTPLYAGVVGPLAADPAGPVENCVQVTGGVTYTGSMYLLRGASGDLTQAQLAIRWYDATGAAISNSIGAAAAVSSGAWARATVTAAAPAAAVWGRLSVTTFAPSVTTATNTLYAAAWQFEQAGAASAWTDPGPTHYAFTGYWEQFVQRWKLSGTWGELDAVGVDALAGLARRQIRDPYVEELLLLGPNFLYALNDPAGSTAAADLTGKRAAAPVENSPFGAGSLTFGNPVTASSSSGMFLGTAGPVATFNNNPSQGNRQEAQTYVMLSDATSAPGTPTGNVPWTRIVSFRCSTVPSAGNFPTLWAMLAPTYSPDLSFAQLYLNPSNGKLSFQESGSNGLGPLYTSAASVCDGNWHQVAICFTGISGYFDVYLDGVRVFHDNNAGAGWAAPTSIATDVIGAFVVTGNNAFVLGWVGDAALMAEFPFALSSAQATNLYNSFRTASSGESSGARASRLLSWVKWPGAVSIDAGSTSSMGPATDLTGGSALDGLNAIAETENGWAYASTSGTLTFRARSALYNSTPMFVFGEHAGAGEWPYEDVALPTDPILSYNIVPVAQYSTGQVATAQDAASQADFFQRTMPQRTVNSTSFAEVQAAAAYLLGRYKSPAMRCAHLALHTSAVPGLARAAAQLEIGTRIRVFKRPPWRSTPIQFDGFVQRIERTVDPANGGDAWTYVEAFPADQQVYWVLAALHTTLGAQAASGQNQATIRALPDAARNPLAASLPQGYQLVFDIGTPLQETMTIAPGGIPSTNIGYQSATLTFTSNFAFTHAAGAVVCEPLPAGYTDPTTWDAASVLGASSTTVVSGGASGTNTITVGPLADAAANPLGSTWNIGDLLRISPGTPNDEGYNLLRPNQATAGEGVIGLAAGTNGQSIGVSSALGSALVTASASAFQGANVWQVSIAANAGLFRCIRVPLADAASGVAHTWSVYVRSATTGANPTVNAQIIFFDSSGSTLSTTNGATATLTGGPSAAWTRVSVTATAPAGAVWAALGVPLNATAPSVSWLFQADALQWESNASASPFCVTPQVKSVAPSVPGYSSVQITLNTNLINSHNPGDIVCDQLPPGVTSPAAVAATTRLAY